MKLTGKVKVWFEDRGFGFVKRDDGADDVFVHASALQESITTLIPGERIEFEEGTNPRSQRPCAVNVRVI